MKAQCRIIFKVKDKNGKTIDGNALRSDINRYYPDEEYDKFYHFEIRRVVKLGKGEDFFDMPILHKTDSNKWDFKEGKTEYIHWGGISFAFRYRDMEIFIPSNIIKI